MITGLVKVLLVNVSVVALPTRVSVAAGNVRVPEAVAEACNTVEPLVEPACVAPLLIVGDVKVLLVRVLVEEIVGTTTPSTLITPAEERARVVSLA